METALKKDAGAEQRVIVGNHAVSHGVRLARAQVVAAYPITPQTSIVEKLSEMCARGELPARFIKVESEHSAMACCLGAATAGARTFTATSSQGLALMHELLHWASGGRLPIVMANVNRAMAPGWNIWTDQTDSLAQRDTGWMQFVCENNQEVLDMTLVAYRVAETVELPAMLSYDAFFLSHTSEIVEVPSQAAADAFLPPFEPRYRLDPTEPRAFGGLTPPDVYMELRHQVHAAAESALEVADRAFDQWAELTGRRMDHVEGLHLEDAETVLVTSGTIASTTSEVVEALRAQGRKVGMLKIRTFRPWPGERVRQALAGARRVGVIDRNLSPGLGGIFCQEVRASLACLPAAPPVVGFIAGLGGRDVVPASLVRVVEELEADPDPRTTHWVDLKEAS